MSQKTIAKSTIALLLSVVGVSLLALVFSSSAAAGFVEADLRVAPPLHPVTWSNVDAPQAVSALTDTTVANFQAGLRGCYVAPSAGGDVEGEVILTPTIGVTFTGTVLPSGWYTGTYDPAGAVTINNGLLTAARAYAATSLTYAPSQTLEFSATFGSAQSEHIGLTGSSDLNGWPWAIFSTGPGDQLYALTHNLVSPEETALGSSYLGAGHRYRIAWTGASVVYSVDGNVVATHSTVTVTDEMRPIVSSVTSAPLVVDWLRMSPYARACTFQSRVLDAGSSVQWLNLASIVSQPAGTIIGGFQTRTGMTSTVDNSWSPWAPVNGITITSPNGRYIVYKVALTTTNPAQTPAVERVALSYLPPAAQTITFNPLPDKIYGDSPFTVVATATSGLPVTFTVSGGVCSIGGATVTLTGVGTCTVTAHQAGNANYLPAPDVSQAFNIAKANQTITFNPLSNKTYGDPPFTVAATASSSLPVTFTVSGGVCSIGGTTVTLTGAGNCTVTAHQAGNANYNPAPDVPQTFNIAKANQTITFNPLPDKTYGDPAFTVVATATSSLPVTFTVSGGACSITGATVTLTGAGICTVTARQAGNANYNPAPDVPQTFNIARANQTITFNPLPDKVIGDPPFVVTATATSGLPVTFTVSGDCSIAGSTITLIRAGTCTVTAYQAGNTNYEPAPNVARTFVIQGVKLYLPILARNVS